MKKILSFVLGASVAVPLWAGPAQREVASLSGDGWKFLKDETQKLDASAADFDDAAWAQVRVPHDWAISAPFKTDTVALNKCGGLPWKGIGWYRRALTLTADDVAAIQAGGAMWLEFDGVMTRPAVFVNGVKVGGWDYGYQSFRVDVAGVVKEGANVIAVRADTTTYRPRWYPGAGIYRDVRLVKAPSVHVVPLTEYVTTPSVTDSAATVRVQYTVTNRLATAVSVTAQARVADTDQTRALDLAPHGAADVSFDFTVTDPKRWDVESPSLYTADLGVSAAESSDSVPVRFGIRTFEWTADDGFHLNGRRLQLKGANLHSDLGPLGMAFNVSAARRQLEIMRDMGCNAIRLSHNPADPKFLDLCDEMGFVVWDECFDKWDDKTADRRKGDKLEEYVVRNLKPFVLRDRNHPCVVVWSIGNEIVAPHEDKGRMVDRDGVTRERCKLFADTVRALDPTRPVGNASFRALKRFVKDDVFADLDLTGWNYSESYSVIREHHPDKPIVYTESASAVSSYGFYRNPLPRNKVDHPEEYRAVCSYDLNGNSPGTDIPDWDLYRMERDRFVAGEFVWTGIDYLGEPSPFNGFARSSYFGAVDLMGLPKDRFYLYRSQWNTSDETIHILPHWNWQETGATNVPVFVYTSGDSAELFLNGKSLGRRAKKTDGVYDTSKLNEKGAFANVANWKENPYYAIFERYRLIWDDVAYEPGELKVVAYRDGKKIGEETIRTAEKPVRVRLTAEKPAIPADGESVVFVQVDLVDANGTRDPHATTSVAFSLTGPGEIVAVGNGDPTHTKSFAETASHPLYSGKAVVVVRRAKGSSDPIELTGSVDGLASGRVTLLAE